MAVLRPGGWDVEEQTDEVIRSRVLDSISTALRIGLEWSNLLSLPESDIQVALDEIWKRLEVAPVSDDPSGIDPRSSRNKVQRLLLKLVLKCHRLPASFTLKGVRCIETESRGSGSFADVYYGTLDDQSVALKRLRVSSVVLESEKLKEEQAFYCESTLWKNLCHEHIVPFLGISEDVFSGFQRRICMVSPWMVNGSIRRFLDDMKQRENLAGRRFVDIVDELLYQISRGLEYLHTEGIVHGDLHSGNILIDENGNARLTDFGMALITDATSYNYASVHGGGAMRWVALELLEPEDFGLEYHRPTPASDVYSFAFICIELYTREKPFPKLKDHQVTKRVLNGDRPPRPALPDCMMSNEMWSLTTSRWAAKPDERLLSRQVTLKLLTASQVQGQPPEGTNGQQRGGITPLPEHTFLQAFKTWTTKQGVPKDERLLTWENRTIDLYALHCEVIKLGGAQRATVSDQWPYIGAKLGFVNFLGTDSEPARSGPGVAQHIQHVYKEFLAAFDNMYIGSVLARHRLPPNKPGETPGLNSQPGAGPGPSSMSVAPNNLPVQNGNAMPGSSMPSNMGMPGVNMTEHENSLLGISQLVGITDPQQIQQLLKWSMLSNDQLRQQGVPGQLIDKVELHHTILQRTYEGQIRFREQLQKNQALGNSGNPTAAFAVVLQRQRLLQNAQLQAQAQAQAAQAQAQQQQHKSGILNPGPGAEVRPGQTPDMQLMPRQSPGPHQQQPSAGPASLSHTEAQNGQSQTRRTRPSPEDVQKALQFVSVVKNEYAQRVKTLKLIKVPQRERMEYNTAFEQLRLYRYVTDMDPKMHVYASFMKDEGVRKLTAVIATAHHQRALLSSGTPTYILDLKTVRSMTEQVQIAQSGLVSYLLNLSGTAPNDQQPPQYLGAPEIPQRTLSQAATTVPSRPPTHPPQPQPTTQPQPPPRSIPTPQPTYQRPLKRRPSRTLGPDNIKRPTYGSWNSGWS